VILNALRETQATVVLATHDEKVARAFGGRLYRLADGRLEAASPLATGVA